MKKSAKAGARWKNTVMKASRRHYIGNVLVLAAAALLVMNFRVVLDGLRGLVSILMPFLMGIALAYIWNLPLRFLERHYFPKSTKPIVAKTRRPVTLLLSLLAIVALLAGILWLLVPQLYDSIVVLGSAIPQVTKDFQAWFLRMTENVSWAEDLRARIEAIDINWDELLKQVSTFFQSGVGGFLGSTYQMIMNVVDNVVMFFTAVVFAANVLLVKEQLKSQFSRLGKAFIPIRIRVKVREWVLVLDESFSHYITGQVTDAFLLGLMMLVAMLIFRFPYALMISAVIMVTALVPMVGSFIGGAVGFLMIAMQDFRQAVLFVLVLVVIQQIDNNFIYPKIVGDATGLPGLWVFVAVMTGGALGGAVGMLVSVPLAAAAYKILARRTKSKLAHDEHKAALAKAAANEGSATAAGEASEISD